MRVISSVESQHISFLTFHLDALLFHVKQRRKKKDQVIHFGVKVWTLALMCWSWLLHLNSHPMSHSSQTWWSVFPFPDTVMKKKQSDKLDYWVPGQSKFMSLWQEYCSGKHHKLFRTSCKGQRETNWKENVLKFSPKNDRHLDFINWDSDSAYSGCS